MEDQISGMSPSMRPPPFARRSSMKSRPEEYARSGAVRPGVEDLESE